MDDERTPDPDIELVPVFETGDAGLIAVVKSILEGEGIDYLVRGEGVQDLFGAGRLTAGFNYITGPAQFLVRSEDKERARELLQDLESSAAPPLPPADRQ
jgi:Putative prokaryotic signal transducing protein